MLFICLVWVLECFVWFVDVFGLFWFDLMLFGKGKCFGFAVSFSRFFQGFATVFYMFSSVFLVWLFWFVLV